MKLSTLSSLFVLLSVVSLIAIAPSAFAAHHEVTITNAPGSATPGCEPNCFVPSTATVEVGAIVTWDNTDTAAHTATAGSPSDGPSGVFDSSLIMVRWKLFLYCRHCRNIRLLLYGSSMDGGNFDC